MVCWFLYAGDGPPPSPAYSVGSSKGARHTKPGVFSPGVVVFSCFSSLIMEGLTRRGESKQFSEKEQDPDRASPHNLPQKKGGSVWGLSFGDSVPINEVGGTLSTKKFIGRTKEATSCGFLFVTNVNFLGEILHMKLKEMLIAAPLAVAAVGATLVAPAQAVDTATWDALAQCESGGNWNINTGNGFYGGVQFTQQSWNGVGMSGSPHGASKAAQIEAAERLLAAQGWGAWPACSAKLGLSGKTGAAPTYQQTQQQQVVQPVQQPKSTPAAVQAPVNQVAATNQQPVKAQAQPVQAPQPSTPAQAATPAVQPKAAPVTPVNTPKAPAPQAAVSNVPAAAPVASGGYQYQVRAGDTLSIVANRLGVPGGWERLWEANKSTVSNPNLIYPGQILTIPA